MSDARNMRVDWITIEWHPVGVHAEGRVESYRCARTHVAEGVLHVYGYSELGDVDQHFPTHHIFVWYKSEQP